MQTLYAHVIDDGGFTFGMDAVTPVSFELSARPRRRGVYTTFVVQKPSRAQAEYAHANPCVVASLTELRARMRALA